MKNKVYVDKPVTITQLKNLIYTDTDELNNVKQVLDDFNVGK